MTGAMRCYKMPNHVYAKLNFLYFTKERRKKRCYAKNSTRLLWHTVLIFVEVVQNLSKITQNVLGIFSILLGD